MKYFWSIIVAIVVIGGVWYALSTNKSPDSAVEAVDTSGMSTTTENAAPADTNNMGVDVGATAVKEFVVEGSNFAFAPKEMRVTEGTKVRIVFKNSGGTHDFVLDEFKARTKILQGGASETIEFVANKKGTFEYYCSIGTHRQMGMRGNLIVE